MQGPACRLAARTPSSLPAAWPPAGCCPPLQPLPSHPTRPPPACSYGAINTQDCGRGYHAAPGWDAVSGGARRLRRPAQLPALLPLGAARMAPCRAPDRPHPCLRVQATGLGVPSMAVLERAAVEYMRLQRCWRWAR